MLKKKDEWIYYIYLYCFILNLTDFSFLSIPKFGKAKLRLNSEIEGREKNGGSLEVMKDEREGEDDNQGDPKKKCVFYYFFTLI